MTESKFVDGNDRIKRLSKRADLKPGVARVRREMREADETYLRGLAQLRQAANKTQVELALEMGLTQGSVSRIESRDDILLSTLNAFVEGLGGHVRVIVEFEDGQSADIALNSLSSPDA